MWHGPAIWFVFIVADLYLTLTYDFWQARNDGPAGWLTFVGFLLGCAWAQTGRQHG